MHNAAFAALGLDWAYVPLPVAPGRVGDAVRGLVALGFAGANVTVPHKQAVIPYLDELTPVARAIGAVNTIVVQPDGSLLGDSTDGAGFMADLRAQGVLVGEGQRIETDKRIVAGIPQSPCHRIPCPRIPVSPCPRPRRRRRGAGGGLRTGRDRRYGGCCESHARYGTGTLSNHRRCLEIYRGDTESAEGFERSQRPQRLCGELLVRKGRGRPVERAPVPGRFGRTGRGSRFDRQHNQLGSARRRSAAVGCVRCVPARPGRLRSDLQPPYRADGVGPVTGRNRAGRTGHVGSPGRPIGGAVDGK